MEILPDMDNLSVTRSRTRLLRAAPLCLLAVLLLSGCNNDPYPAGESASSTLFVTMGAEPKTFDPSIGYDATVGPVIDAIYPDYFQYHYLKRDPFVLQLGLGATDPERAPYPCTVTVNGKKVRKTGESWTFHIKHGLRFQDDPCFPNGKGREIIAADFVYSFKRMADPAVPCPVVSYFSDKILGMSHYQDVNSALVAKKQPADYSLPIEGLQLDPKDPYTFRILLSDPYPQLRYLMAMHFTSPLAHEAVEKYGKDLAFHPVGCGPFVLAEYVPRGRIVLKANPNYRKDDFYPSDGAPGDREAGLLEDAGKQLPLIKEVRFTIIREGITAWNQFQQGYLDVAGVTQDNFQQAMSNPTEISPDMKRKGIRLSKQPHIEISYFGFNMTDPLWGGYSEKQRKLRQAVSLAVDSQEIIDLESLGLGEPADSVIPPGIFGFDKSYKNPYRQFNIEKAKQLLVEAGYPNGIDPQTGDRLVLNYDNYATSAAGRQFIALIQRQIGKLGIHVESRSTLLPGFQDKLDHGQFQFFYYGWIADYPDPENFVFMFYGPNKRPGPNANAYANPKYDALFEQMRAMPDNAQRLKIIDQMRDIVVEDCPWIYVDYPESFGLVHSWFHNYKPNPVANDMAKYYRIDTAERARKQAEWNRPNYIPAVVVVALLIFGSLPAVNVVKERTNRHVRRNSEGAR
jgi:oligopeptide transport system substrate-binding protein